VNIIGHFQPHQPVFWSALWARLAKAWREYWHPSGLLPVGFAPTSHVLGVQNEGGTLTCFPRNWEVHVWGPGVLQSWVVIASLSIGQRFVAFLPTDVCEEFPVGCAVADPQNFPADNRSALRKFLSSWF